MSSQELEKTSLGPARVRQAADLQPSHTRWPLRAPSCHSLTSASPFIPSCSSPLLLITSLKQEKGVADPICGPGKGCAKVRLRLHFRVIPHQHCKSLVSGTRITKQLSLYFPTNPTSRWGSKFASCFPRGWQKHQPAVAQNCTCFRVCIAFHQTDCRLGLTEPGMHLDVPSAR